MEGDFRRSKAKVPGAARVQSDEPCGVGRNATTLTRPCRRGVTSEEPSMRLSTVTAAAVMLAALSTPAFAQATGGVITIDGRGEVTAAPDTAFINSGVTTQGATAREALDANTAAMTQLIDLLRASGIEPRDIQTSGFSVSPNYVYSDARDANGYTLPPKITGYQVYNTVMIRVRNLDALGSVLDQSVDVGANTINGITFSVADTTALLDEARRKAFADARRKAELYAGLAEGELGDIRSVSETQNFTSPEPYMMRAEAAMAGDSAVPVQGGELTFSIGVQVSWTLED
jgi:uncharacterized protein